MKQELTNTIKVALYHCPVCNEQIEATGASKYVCSYCKHELEAIDRTDMGITYSELSVCKESVYCPDCSHALKIELSPSSAGDTYFCINSECELHQNKTRFRKNKNKRSKNKNCPLCGKQKINIEMELFENRGHLTFSETHNLYRCPMCEKIFKEITCVDYTEKHNESMVIKMFTLFIEEVC